MQTKIISNYYKNRKKIYAKKLYMKQPFACGNGIQLLAGNALQKQETEIYVDTIKLIT